MKTFSILIAILFALMAFGFTDSSSTTETFRVGDVQHSILSPDQFRSLPEGENWLPLDGGVYASLKGINLNKTTLATKFGINKLPDARGMFIRSMNLGRDDIYSDPESSRSVGEPQKGQSNNINNFRYTWQSAKHGTITIPNNGEWSGHISTGKGQNGGRKDGIQIQKKGTETRPNNISLFTYIKVN
ncbi:hypothetical protein [Tenacibaculum xiamenense]|uniref:hypothetical protein n=1 Tax=Tenacibaculum xiamenense TaxID=1261553 RepID=UPI0038939AA9